MNLFIVNNAKLAQWSLPRTSGNRQGLETFLITCGLGQVAG